MAEIKMLFMHATAICPRDDVSDGMIEHDLKWSDNRLMFGSFDSRREEILTDVENGRLNMVITGHSHRNLVMQVDSNHKDKAKVLGAGERYGTIKRQPKNIVMVTSSGGPLPKYLPGGPLICACTDKYETGWDYKKGTLYSYCNDGNYLPLKQIVDPPECPDCHMPAKK